jgi:putative hydrolase of the HAD superfamily
VIFFDIDGTLFKNKRAQTLAALSFYNRFKKLHVIYEESVFPERWNQVTENYVQLFFNNQLSFHQQRRNRLKEIFRKDFTNSEADKIFSVYLKFYEENWPLFDDVIPCINMFKSHKLGVISNGDKAQQRQKLRELNITERFDTVIISSDIGISKPDPKVFWYACKTTNNNPAKCYYVGDSLYTDAKAANLAGLIGVWLNREQHIEKDKNIVEIKTLSKLSQVIHS